MFIEAELVSGLSRGLKSVQLPADAIEIGNLSDRNAESAESGQSLGSSDSRPAQVGGTLPTPDTVSNNHRGRPVLSGLSLTNMSIVSIIKLPLREIELQLFHRLASQSVSELRDYDDAFFSLLDSARMYLDEQFNAVYDLNQPARSSRPSESRLRNELADLGRDPPPMVALGPIGDDMVR
jgi:hypothetical protein